MTYLPWTPSFFTMLPPVPVLLFLIISGGFLILGLVMYMTSADMSIEDLLSLIPRVTVAVRKHLNRKKVLGLFLIVIGGLATATFADQANAQYLTTAPTGGGPSLYQCSPPFNNLACWTNGASAGAILATNSTLCNAGNAPNCGSCPSSPPSPCLTKIESGVTTCTVSAGQTNCNTLVSFSPVYSTTPTVWTYWDPGTAQTAGTANLLVAGLPVSQVLVFQATNGTAWNMPIANTELNSKTGSQRLQWQTPSVLTVQTGVLCIGTGAIGGAPQYTVQSSTDQSVWTNLGSDGIAVSPGVNAFTCTSESISLTAGTTYYFRIMGNDFLGPALDTAGTIQFSIYGTGATQTIAYVVNCGTLAQSITATNVRVFANCGSVGLVATKTFKVDWVAGILA